MPAARIDPGMDDLRSAPVPPLAADDHVRGPAGARLVIVYGDFTCPRCALAAERIRGLPLRVVFRHFALRAKHPRAVPLALAAEAAGLQGRFWEMHDALYADPGHVDDPHLWARADRIGLDVERFESDRRAVGPAARVAGQVRDGMRAGVAVTPTLFVDGLGHPGPPDTELLDRLLGGAGRSSSMVGFG
jgi:protein-disulfide isomerase